MGSRTKNVRRSDQSYHIKWSAASAPDTQAAREALMRFVRALARSDAMRARTNGDGLVVNEGKEKSSPSAAPPGNKIPRGLSREQAAAYVGVSPTLFDDLVRTGSMPKPKRIRSRTVWDRLALDRSFEQLPNGDEHDIWGFKV